MTASVCDYKDFDFTWHPDIGEEKYIHAWTTQDNKYGYTFFIPKKEFEQQLKEAKNERDNKQDKSPPKDDNNRGNNQPAKTSQGVTTSQFQAFRN